MRVRTRGNPTLVYWGIAILMSLFFGVVVGDWVLGPEPIFNHPWGMRVFGGLSSCFLGLFWGFKTWWSRRIGSVDVE